MAIISIKTIQAEAESAAQAGLSKSEACPFHSESEARIKWSEFYDAAKNSFEHQVARYRAAIGVSAN